ncbi:MAG: NUDIX hydrolase [Actinomycetales bacterium]|nr:NUDIX hydrolase [Tetrasphaera sp.]NLW99952.1 NUDIX hydrolase [Actinomycetales bacterium]
MGEHELGYDLTSDSAEAEANRLAFIEILNSRMPKKRLIAQGLLRSTAGHVLLCQLTYKRDWDLPGGVVDPGESPATCVVREVEEELGLTLSVQGLLAVNWLPPYRGWDDALLCLFDLGVVEPSVVHGVALMRREIQDVHWVPPADLPNHVAPYTAAMLTEVLDLVSRPDDPRTAYIENSERVRFRDDPTP